jgi:hypothetical protein
VAQDRYGRRHLLDGAVSGPIGQALSDYPFERFARALCVVNAERNAVAVAKVELGKIAV